MSINDDDEPTKECAPPRTEKPTVKMEAVPDWAVGLTKDVKFIRGNVEILADDMTSLKGDVRALQRWQLDCASVVSLPAITSERVRAVVDERASHLDLDAQAREAEQIIKNAERDRQIAETRALVEQAATKVDVKVLAESTATKAEVEALIQPLTVTQDIQLAILARLDKVASNPTVKVVVGMIATALLTWLASHGGSLK